MPAMRPNTALEPLRRSDFSAVEALAKAIWREHYSKLLSEDQIEYMLARKYTQEDLAPFIDAPDRWFDVLRVEGEIGGFLRCVRENASELKLSEIYLSKAFRGLGLGQLLLARAETLARSAGCRAIVLYVNRRNTGAVEVYERAGFAIKRECDFDIGHGYVMDDYLMEKPLSP